MSDVIDQLQAAIDARRWQLGDLACLVAKHYGRNTIAAFAKDIGEPVARLRGYRTVSAFFDRGNATRVEFSDSDVVSWSHFREALRLRKHYGEQAAQAVDDFIRYVADNALTVEKAKVKLSESLGKPTPPLKLFDGELCAEAAGEWIVFRLKLDGAVQPRKMYTVKVYEAEQEAL